MSFVKLRLKHMWGGTFFRFKDLSEMVPVVETAYEDDVQNRMFTK